MAHEDSLGFILGRALRLHKQRSNQHFNGLHPGQAPVMFALWREDGQKQKDLANRLRLTPATVTVSVNRLEKAGLLTRRKDPHDQRISRVYLTELGRSMHEQVVNSIRTTDKECLAGFSDEEQAMLMGFLTRITTNLRTALEQHC